MTMEVELSASQEIVVIHYFFFWYYLVLKKSFAYILIKSKKKKTYKDHAYKVILYIVHRYECICNSINKMTW